MSEDIFHLAVKALIRNSDGKFLVLENNSRKGSLNPPHWDLPGGRLEKGDTIEETLRREVEEEISTKNIKIIKQIDASISKLRLTIEDYGIVILTYLCTVDNEDEVKLTDDEHLIFKWCSKDEVAELLKVKFSDSFIQALKEL